MIVELVNQMLLAVKGSSVSEIEYNPNGLRLRIVRGAGQPAGAGETPSSAPSAAPVPQTSLRTDARHIIRAGMHGTFCRASAPDQAPLTDVGLEVEAGQSLGLIESMKMLHAVETDHPGRIAEILATNGAAVEPGTPLFAIELKATGNV